MANKIPINSIIVGDCRERMKQIPDESVDLIYLDPPFFSARQYDLIWGKNDSKATIKAFEDAALYKKVCGKCGRTWRINPKTGKYYATCRDGCTGKLKDTKSERMNIPEVFTEWLKEAIKQCYRVIKPTGTIYCHLDWHSVHYVKVMMDKIFGYDNFRNEIIWQRTNAKGKATDKFNVNHDTILVYKKGLKCTFNIQFGEIEIPKNSKEDHNGTYVTQPVIVKNRGSKDKTRTVNGKAITLDDSHGWYWSQETIDEYESAGYDFEWSSNNIPRYKKYFDTGKPCDDIWHDMYLHPSANERIGYTTQKPESLLERIIKAGSNEDDLILDPFCGCGTAIVVAQRLGRKWIGIDIEPLSCTVMQTRMQNEFGIAVPLLDLEKTLTEDEAVAIVQQSHKMNPFEFQDWVVKVLGGKPNPAKSGDGGIDGWIDKPFGDLKKGDPIQVKMSAKVGDPVVKLFAFNTMNEGRDHGVIVAYSFSSTAEKTAKEIREQHGIEIWLMTVKDMLVMTSKKTVRKAHEHHGGVQGKLQ